MTIYNASFITSELEPLLRREIACATALLQSLESEKSALSNLDDKLIALNSANKQKLITSLQTASAQRVRYMSANGNAKGIESIKLFLESDQASPELRTLFGKLNQLAQQCFSENRMIGQLINRRTQFITQVLSSLSPASNFKELTYSESGSTFRQSDLRNIGTI